MNAKFKIPLYLNCCHQLKVKKKKDLPKYTRCVIRLSLIQDDFIKCERVISNCNPSRFLRKPITVSSTTEGRKMVFALPF